jgi:hypothetical protein
MNACKLKHSSLLSGLYYKHITIIMTSVKVIPQFWSVTLRLSIMVLEASFTLPETSFVMFIVQVSLTTVTHDGHL